MMERKGSLMKTFYDLKEKLIDISKSKKNFCKLGELNFQIYESHICQFNIQTRNYRYPVIKFEERSKDIFTVAVTETSEVIEYSKSHSFNINDSIDTLLDIFPSGQDINVIVEELKKL